MLPAADFWQDKRVLLTGHTGFKGSWLTLWLNRMGAHVTGIALAPNSEPSLFDRARIALAGGSHLCDIRDAKAVASIIRHAQPEIVLHLAAQPLVRASYRQPLETLATNIMGTAHVLDALRAVDGVRVALMITTDKVYHNREWPFPYREGDELGGHDPYSASKAAAEIVVASFRDAFLTGKRIAVATARAGNVIGGGDWSEDRLIPDAIRAWDSNNILQVRRPQAMRPWQHVLDPLAGYLLLAERLHQQLAEPGAYNFGPHTAEAASVRDVIELARHHYGRGEVRHDDEPGGPHEAGWLALETAKARTMLGVTPRWPLSTAVERTMFWYRQFANGVDARVLCENDIDAYLGQRHGDAP